MSDAIDHAWLTITEAAVMADVSTKTIYRHINRGNLHYRRGPDNRRRIRADELLALFELCGANSRGPESPLTDELMSKLAAIEELLARQQATLEKLVSLYQPRSLKDLVEKHVGQK